jgi:hypothetical protein
VLADKSKTIIIITSLLFITNTASANPTEAWRTDQACGERLADFQATTLKACIRAFCATLPDHTQLCACEKEDANDVMEVERIAVNGQKTFLLKTTIPFSFGAESFSLHSVDFAGNGKNQLLLGILSSQSNGMAVQYWTVWAIDGDQVSKPIEMEDYGTMSFTTRAKQESACNLLVSRWISGWEAKRGNGLYIAGLWYQLSNGEFLPNSERPTIFRRYSSELERQREQALYQQGTKPILWYKSRDAHRLVGPDLFRYHKE